MKSYVIAIDQGTTSCRAIVLNRNGEIVSQAQEEFAQHYPQPGWVEHDAEEIWTVQLRVLRDAAASIPAEEIAAIGITNQRETTVLWDRVTGKPVHPAIVWQCRRSDEICQEFRSSGYDAVLREKTGLVLDPYFSGTKVKWIMDRYPEIKKRAEQGDILFGTIDSWLLWNLTQGAVHATDVSNASRTLLFNIHTLDWDDDILAEFRIPRCMLPAVRSSSEIYGYTDALGGGIAVPVSGAAGDQQAALFGQSCFEPGMAKNTYGTGCFMLLNTGTKAIASKNGLLTTIAWKVGETTEYALEGSVFIAGAVVQWLRDGLGIIEKAAESEAIAASVKDTEGVYFVPAFTGLGSPYWNAQARGMITGLTRGTSKAHLVRASLEAIAYQTRDVLQLMEQESGIQLKELRVDGGAVSNRFLMQFQSDLLNAAVVSPKIQETTALGAAYLAGLAVGFWTSKQEIANLWKSERMYRPEMSESERQSKYEGWKRAVGYQTHPFGN